MPELDAQRSLGVDHPDRRKWITFIPPPKFESALRELRRALHITPSSEKRRQSGSPLAGVPRAAGDDAAKSPKEKLEQKIAEQHRLADWHRDLKKRHGKRIKKLKEKLAKMTTNKTRDDGPKRAHQPERLEDIELEHYCSSKRAAPEGDRELRAGRSDLVRAELGTSTSRPIGGGAFRRAHVRLRQTGARVRRETRSTVGRMRFGST